MLLYNLESKPLLECKPPWKVSPPTLQCISDEQVCRRDPLFESKLGLTIQIIQYA